MDILKKIYRAVWNFMLEYAEHRAQCIRRRGINSLY